MSGTSDKLVGTLKEGWGNATGDRDLESEGKGEHAVGSVKIAAADVKEAAKDKGEHAVGAVTDVAKDVTKKAKDVKDRATSR
jgi:uncharacterized protein YjbJ (UPF0337 family)